MLLSKGTNIVLASTLAALTILLIGIVPWLLPFVVILGLLGAGLIASASIFRVLTGRW